MKTLNVFFEKVLDKLPGLWYIIVTGGGTPHPGSGGGRLPFSYKTMTKNF